VDRTVEVRYLLTDPFKFLPSRYIYFLFYFLFLFMYTPVVLAPRAARIRAVLVLGALVAIRVTSKALLPC